MKLDEKGVCTFIRCIGVYYDDYLRAYGAAFQHASRLAANRDDPATLSLLFELGGSTGFGISVLDKNGKEICEVCILDCDDYSGGFARGRT